MTKPEVPEAHPFCPVCKGSTFESIEEVIGPSVGAYRVTQCTYCGGEGTVARADVARILDEFAKKKP